jgi:hypothetical protein
MRIARSSVPLHLRAMTFTGRKYADSSDPKSTAKSPAVSGPSAVAVASVFALFSLTATAQDRPNFSGEWITVSLVGDETARGSSVGTDRDGHMTISQDATTLAIAWVSYSRAHQPVKAIVNFDGSERRYIDRNSIEPHERTTRASWLGAQLVITTTWAGRGPGSSFPSPVETEETLSLESASRLKVSVTRRVRDQVWKATRVFRRQ